MAAMRSSVALALATTACNRLFEDLDLFVMARGSDGAFGAAAVVATASTIGANEIQPTIDPTQRRLWFVRDGALIEAIAT